MTDDTLRTEIAALFTTFLPADLGARFSALLHLKPARWVKIDPGKVLPDAGITSARELKGDIATLLNSLPLAAHADAEVTVLRCGHDQPKLSRLRLCEALIGERSVFEGFISIVAGKLGLVVTHNGEIFLLSGVDRI